MWHEFLIVQIMRNFWRCKTSVGYMLKFKENMWYELWLPFASISALFVQHFQYLSIFHESFFFTVWIIQLNYDSCPFLRQNVLFNTVIVQGKYIDYLNHTLTPCKVLKYLTHVPLTHFHKFTSTIHIPKSTYNLLCA